MVAIICILAGIGLTQFGLTRCAILEQAANRELQILNSAYRSYLASGGNKVEGDGTHDDAVAAVAAMKGTVNGIGPFILSEGNVDLNACQGTPVPIILVDSKFQTPNSGTPIPSPSASVSPTPDTPPAPTPTATASATTTPDPTPYIQVEGVVIINPAALSVGQTSAVTLRLTNRNSMAVDTTASVSSQDEGIFAGTMPSYSGSLAGNSTIEIPGVGTGIAPGTTFVGNSVTTIIGTASVSTPVSVFGAATPTPTSTPTPEPSPTPSPTPTPTPTPFVVGAITVYGDIPPADLGRFILVAKWGPAYGGSYSANYYYPNETSATNPYGPVRITLMIRHNGWNEYLGSYTTTNAPWTPGDATGVFTLSGGALLR